MSPERANQYCLMAEFMLDLIHPEQYGHAIPLEVRLRAARILKIAPAEVAAIAPCESPPAVATVAANAPEVAT